ncbi:ribose transport system substrate-binding protein [Paraburkholderia sacchari]|uniref:sugar ABC transporter substrate-binding protein n=1 Tax=Paraburkholderia sacchari TaxID=159450 RepID=UPI0039A7600C
MKLMRKLGLAACIMLGLTAFTAAQGQTPDWLKQPLKKPLGDIVIGLAAFSVGNNGYTSTYDSTFRAYAKELGVKVIVYDAQMDPQKQASQIQNLVAQNVDALVVWAVDGKAVVPSLKRAHDAGVPVMITNAPIDPQGSKYVQTFTGPNDYAEAAQAGELMAKALNGKGNVVMVNGSPGFVPSEKRVEGFVDVIKKYPGIKILDSQTAYWSREKAQTLMENYITRFGDKIDGVYAAESGMGAGALSAVQAAVSAGRLKPDHIKFVDCTLTYAGYDAIKKGPYYYGSVLQSPSEDARLALKAAVQIAEGKTVPKTMSLETPSLTAENIGKIPRPSW